MGAPVVHFEINSGNLKETSEFYSKLFGWKVTPYTDNYNFVDTLSGAGVNGAIGLTDQPAHVTFYVEVPDPQAALDKVQKLGGKTEVPVTEIPDIVTFAVFSDVAGNKVGLVKADEGQEPTITPGPNAPVAWFEVLGPDGAALHTFYSELFGWKIKASEFEGFIYGEVDTVGKRGIPGGIGASRDGSPVVTVYAKVPDLATTLVEAEKLGAKTVLEPLDVGQGTKVAAFKDPQGNLFGLFTSTS